MKITLPLVAALITGFLCHQASAAPFNIADGDVDALKAAIASANANGQNDTINLAPNGTYTLFTADNSTNGGNGLPVIGADGGNSLTFAGHGATIQRDPNFPTPNFRILQIGPGSVVTLDAMTIANGRATDTTSSFLGNLGGGVVNDHGTLTVTNCIFTQNQAGFGGAISNSADGGSTSMSVTDSTFRENSAGGEGGGIYHRGTGGTATLTITSCTFFLNNGAFGGGGIFNDGRSGSATLNVTRSTFNLNSGSGIYNLGIASITNSTFSQNSAQSETGRAIYNNGLFGSASLLIGSNILQVDSGTTLANDSGVVTSLGYNLSTDDGAGWLIATGDQISADPMLDPVGLRNNGGPTDTVAISASSPAIDKGKDFTGTGLDQRGVSRPFVLRNRPSRHRRRQQRHRRL